MTDQPNPLAGKTQDDLVALFMKLRDALDSIRGDFKEREARAKGGLEVIQSELLRRMNAEGVENFRTSHGTAYVSRQTRANCGDWNALHDHIRDTGAFDLLQRRLSVSAVQAYNEETGGNPPGCTTDTFREVRIRKS